MSATNVKLSGVRQFQMDCTAVSDLTAVPAEGVDAVALEGNVPALVSDWTYSATAENNAGEVAVNGMDQDDFEGIIYNGPSGVTVRVVVKNFDVDLGIINAGSGDTLALGLFKDNDLIAFAEGNFHGELEDEVIEEFNIDAIIYDLQETDVIRLCWMQGSENAELDLEVVGGGSLSIS